MNPTQSQAITLHATPLTLNQAETFRRFTVDKAHGDAARRAAGYLALLTQQIGTGDLLRHAATLTDGLAWLKDLATQADTMRQAIIQQRRDADAVVAADHAVRGRLDAAAVSMAVELQDTIRHAQARLTTIDAGTSATRAALSGAGLADTEIQAVLAARTDGGDHEAMQLRATIESSTAKLAAANRFLADPMRDVGVVPEALLAEFEVIAGVLRHRQENPTTTTFSMRVAATA